MLNSKVNSASKACSSPLPRKPSRIYNAQYSETCAQPANTFQHSLMPNPVADVTLLLFVTVLEQQPIETHLERQQKALPFQLSTHCSHSTEFGHSSRGLYEVMLGHTSWGGNIDVLTKNDSKAHTIQAQNLLCQSLNALQRRMARRSRNKPTAWSQLLHIGCTSSKDDQQGVLACTLPSPTINAIPWATAHNRAHMAVRKLTRRQNPSIQFDRCFATGLATFSAMLETDLFSPFSRSLILSSAQSTGRGTSRRSWSDEFRHDVGTKRPSHRLTAYTFRMEFNTACLDVQGSDQQ